MGKAKSTAPHTPQNPHENGLADVRPRHISFARLLVFGDGNGVTPGVSHEAYAATYDVGSVASAKAGASRLTRRDDVRGAIRYYEVERDLEAQAWAQDWAEHADEMRTFLVELKRDKNAPKAVRLKAAEVYLAYSFGRPAQQINASINVEGDTRPSRDVDEVVARAAAILRGDDGEDGDGS